MIGFRTEIISATNNTAIVESSFKKYDVLMEDFVRNTKGSLCATADGTVSSYALKDLEKLGSMFVAPGQQVYIGQLVGECKDEKDYDINVTKQKELNNIRLKGKEETVRLTPHRVFTIEEAIGYIRDQDVLEITPKNIRIRKTELDKKVRAKNNKNKKLF